LTKAKGRILDGLEEDFGSGGAELVVEDLVNIVIKLELVELLFVEADGFGYLGAGGTVRVC
jgi:hypothetical protein